MRLTILALFLYTGVAAFCQSAAPVPASPEKPWRILPGATNSQPARDFSKLPQEWHFTTVAPRMKTMTILPGPLALGCGSDAQIDPKIVAYPPQASLGEQPPGTLVAQNLYPGLQLLPIEESKGKAELLPTTWPTRKIERIPIVWPKGELLPVDSGAKGQAAGK
jgi:hypothetical protein